MGNQYAATYSDEVEIHHKARRYMLQLLTTTGGILPLSRNGVPVNGYTVRLIFDLLHGAARKLHGSRVPGIVGVWLPSNEKTGVAPVDLKIMYEMRIVNIYPLYSDIPTEEFMRMLLNERLISSYSNGNEYSNVEYDEFTQSMLLAERLQYLPAYISKAVDLYSKAMMPLHEAAIIERLSLLQPTHSHLIAITPRGIAFGIRDNFFHPHETISLCRKLGLDEIANEIEVKGKDIIPQHIL